LSGDVVDSYGWESAEGPHSCQFVAPVVLQALKAVPGGARILDLGSGNGALAAWLSKQGYEVVGVEFDAGGIEVSRRTYPQIPFYQFGVQDDPAELLKKESPFDVVVSTEVIEHLYSPHLLPLFAAGVLKADGYLLISTPYHGYLKNLAISIFGKWDHHHTVLWHGGHIKFWSLRTLSSLLGDNGFAVKGVFGIGRVRWLWRSMLLVAKKK
jgi:2-polyprenyl-3-methyl-5-hydroxy-6-metoxy-1,4-benzoquinol methylase